MTITIQNRFKTQDEEEFSDIEDIAVGDESREIYIKSEVDIINHYLLPISRQLVYCIKIKFMKLKFQWEAETAMMSSITEIAMHPSYQQIIGMGPVVVPLILSEIEKKSGHWFWALKSITGEDPVLLNQRGRVKEMTQAWLRWGKEHNYL